MNFLELKIVVCLGFTLLLFFGISLVHKISKYKNIISRPVKDEDDVLRFK